MCKHKCNSKGSEGFESIEVSKVSRLGIVSKIFSKYWIFRIFYKSSQISKKKHFFVSVDPNLKQQHCVTSKFVQHILKKCFKPQSVEQNLTNL